ncbi:uncharacterized protein PFL1_01722 [Pseudozyma flocculosa PF-1]|uniref:Related to translation elongation factor eEF1, gamma chain n=1 Tax=Pseudozyma flocculosa TaxID=84751 RepID=A0A5C3F0L7_9BASI|nr:uncharacterized protein PFL1_01722 [Pseudozyma flocculosa PF-1]EPQ30823.1 hypothetical protein PFL1_01722 [Pseudozyma flocculosa PF-1]SPO36811.1 related to translation elongation factor eEF1, gamma chain [Pseudozyma flocculosa]
MAPIGSLYGYPGHGKIVRALAAAKYNGVELDLVQTVPSNGDTQKPEYLADFPYGKIPAFKGTDGFKLTESRAIARYIAGLSDNSKLLGTDAKSAAEVEQWIDFADEEIWNNFVTILLLTKNILPYNKAAETKAWDSLHRASKFLEASLKKKTFLVGHRVTLADLTVASNLQSLYGMIAGQEFRSQYPNTARYYQTIAGQPTVLDLFKMEQRSENAKFVAPKKEEKPKAAPAPKKEAAKPKAKEVDDEDDEPKAAPPPKNPLDSLPKSSFILDEWKRTYSNEDTRPKALPWFFENFDYDGYSVVKLDYKYNDELTLLFMSSNLITGLHTRLEANRKYIMGTMGVFGENNNNAISGVYVVRGQNPAEVLSCAPDIESYSITPLDLKKDEDKKLFEDYMAWEAVTPDGKQWADGKIMK